MKNGLSVLFILIAGILWGTIGLFVRYFNAAGFSPNDLIMIRCLTSLIFFGLFILLADRKLFRIRLRDCWIFIGSGIVCFIGFNFLYYSTINLTSLSVAAVLLNTAPIFVILFSALLFKEKLTAKKLFCLALAFSGCVLVTGIFGSESNITVLGFIMGIGSGLGYGLYSIFTRFGLMKYHTLTHTFYTFLFASIASAFMTDHTALIGRITTSGSMIALIILFAFTSCILPYLFYNTGLRNIETGKAAIIACSEPVTATIISIVILKENFDILMLLGIVLVLLAICLLNINRKKAN